MYTVTSFPLVNRTLAILRNAELGFFGVMVRTTKHTPCLCGQPSSAGALLNFRFGFRGFRTSWLMVGICQLSLELTATFCQLDPAKTLIAPKDLLGLRRALLANGLTF